MTRQEYEQKREQEWRAFCNRHGILDRGHVIIISAFFDAFDRAYALGKHEKDAGDDRTLKVNRQLFCRLCADADDYINEHLEEEDSDYTYYQGRSDALHELNEDNFASIEPKEDTDKHFDNILKDGFSKERRLNIAAMAMQGILAYGELVDPDEVTGMAIIYADKLIEEAEKGVEE